jgi:hypothetical protein
LFGLYSPVGGCTEIAISSALALIICSSFILPLLSEMFGRALRVRQEGLSFNMAKASEPRLDYSEAQR